jgi:hypothetical protein
MLLSEFMPTTTRTFRVFVSSTFEDLKEERNALQREVFPKLRALCEQHSARFQAIDLRWGVRDEAALDQRTLDICLTEIQRCQRTGVKPNFIVLLGDRYGWCPLPAHIEANEFESILAEVPETDKHELLWERNAVPPVGSSRGWYRRDDNAIPAEYVLLPREVLVAADASEDQKNAATEKEAAEWSTTEKRLRQVLLSAIDRLGWSVDDPRRLQYEASATHREILKGLGDGLDDLKHVFAFVQSPVPTKDGSGPAPATNDTAVTPLPPEDVKVQDLKKFLHERFERAQLGSNVIEYKRGDLGKLCADVEGMLTPVILGEISRFESRAALDMEIQGHNDFARERCEHFGGRDDTLEAIRKYLADNAAKSLMLYGASGVGKSAVMAKASIRAETELTNAVVIRRFINVSPESSSGTTLLRSICQELANRYGATDETPADFNGVAKAFRERLALATSARRLVLFIDALDQLPENDFARSFSWLPTDLPPWVKVVLSGVTAGVAPAGPSPPIRYTIPIELLTLPKEQAEKALDSLLKEANRKLQDHQRSRVLDCFDRCGLPLYLRLAFEEARRWRSFEGENECRLGEELSGIIDTLFARLAEERNHGRLMTERSLGYLVASRYGLTEDEVLDILSEDKAVFKDFQTRAHYTPPEHRLPAIVWSRLYFDLERYLTERPAPGGTVLTLYHSQMQKHWATRLLADNDCRWRHRALAEHFANQPLCFGNNGRSVSNLRVLSELPYQQTSARMSEEVFRTLTDPEFVELKCATEEEMTGKHMRYYGVYSLIEDIDRELEFLRDDGGRQSNSAPSQPNFSSLA